MTYPSFSAGDVLAASDMNAVGLWRITSGITATNGTVSDGVVTIGSNVASVTVSGCFSSSFDNYRIIASGIDCSASASLTFQLSGITGSSYLTGGTYFTYASATVNGYGPAATTSWVVGPSNTTQAGFVMDLLNPHDTSEKNMFSQGSGTASYYSFGGVCTSTSSATGFVLASNSGNLTGGKIRVYGYRD